MAGASSPSYFDWLYSQLEVERYPRYTYGTLYSLLFKREFTWFIHNDDNRVLDGISLREEYYLAVGVAPSVHISGCSVLEMMIGLARRASYEDDRTPAVWFGQFLLNLGLTEAIDANFNRDPDWYGFRANLIIDNIINRTYSYSGEGGLFPLNDPQEDQRQVELWYQMSAYLLENSPV